jgi:6-phosphogluconolactonase (cycloisomerase 2 family)
MYLDSGEILQVQLDNNGGATPKASAAFCSYPILLSTGQYARSPMVASTDGKYLFSIDGTGTKICSYTLSSTGAPFKTAVPFVSTNSTWSLEALPGRILAFDRFVNFLYNYAIDSAGKATQYLSQDISDPTAGGFPDFGTYRLAPGGKYLYALKTGSTRNSESGCYYTDVLSYAVEGDGRLSLKSGFQKPIKTDGNYCGDNFGEGLTINAAGTALYIPARDSGKIYQFSLSADGSIQPMATPSVETGGAAAAPYKLLSSPDGKFLYALDGDANLFWQYAVAANGQLSALTTPTAAACSPSYGKPIFADIDPVTGIIYLTCKSESELYAFRGGANGNLALLKTTPLGLIYPETFVFGR